MQAGISSRPRIPNLHPCHPGAPFGFGPGDLWALARTFEAQSEAQETAEVSTILASPASGHWKWAADEAS